MDPPVVLVTGASGGIGREAVLHLAEAGCLVVATARRMDALEGLRGPGVETLRLDVTSEADRAAAVAATLERHGRIDALVNNAGYGAMLAVEDTRLQDLRAVFETNLFGLHDLTRRVLPAMRARGSGRIVNVSSIAGHLSVPLLGAYCASKFALRALSQALHNEVRRFGVRVSLVEPGVIRTGFGERSLQETRAAALDVEASPYAPLYRQWLAMRVTRGGAHPRVIARRIVHAVTARRPRFHYFGPWYDAKVGNVLKRVAPDALLNAGMRAYFRGR